MRWLPFAFLLASPAQASDGFILKLGLGYQHTSVSASGDAEFIAMLDASSAVPPAPTVVRLQNWSSS